MFIGIGFLENKTCVLKHVHPALVIRPKPFIMSENDVEL